MAPVLGEVGAEPADEANSCRMVAMPRSIGLIARPAEDPDDSAEPTGES